VSPYLLYEDAAAAVDYLRRSFGFELGRSEIGGAGRAHNELVLGDRGLVMLGQADEGFSSPRTLGSFSSSMIHVYVDDVTTLHARPNDAGTEATELELSPAGDRRFTATDRKPGLGLRAALCRQCLLGLIRQLRLPRQLGGVGDARARSPLQAGNIDRSRNDVRSRA